MTVRPVRPNFGDSVGESFQRTRSLERAAHGPWIYVGLGILNGDGSFNPLLSNDVTGTGTIPAPDFQNGWVNEGGDMQEMRFRWLFAGGLEIQGSVIGGAIGSVVFTLPDGPFYRPNKELRLDASTDAGTFVVFRVRANGDVVYGI